MSVFNRARDRDANGCPLRKYRLPKYTMSTPGYWVHIYMTRPRRQENRHLCHRVLSGDDPDGIVWPVGNHKPHEYYW